MAIPRERDACVREFKRAGAMVEERDDVVEIEHADYRVVVITGKALIAATGGATSCLRKWRTESIRTIKS